MKKLFFAAAAACCAWSAVPAAAQYNGYAPQAPAGYGMPSFQRTQPAQPGRTARPAASVAMRPTTATFAAQPASYQFKPVNPPTQTTQRILMASKNTPTPAPPMNGAPAARPAAASAPPQQYWNSSAANSQPWINGNTAPAYGGGAPYAGGAAYAGGPVEGDFGGQCCGAEGGDACGTCGGCCLAGHRCCCCIRSTGDLVQHMPFFGTTHGYYYFRPYHVMHVFSQQELATRWGGDARNPYDNCLFQKVYEQMGVAATLPASTVEPITTVPDYSVPGGTQVVPTPIPASAPSNGPAPQYGPNPHYGPNPQYMPAPQYVPGQNVVPTPGAPTQQPGVEYLPAR